MSNVFNRDAGTEKRVEIMENKDGETKVKDQIKIALYKSPFIINWMEKKRSHLSDFYNAKPDRCL